MSSFFTTPASLKKRKREDTNGDIPQRRATLKTNGGKAGAARPTRKQRDESISSAGSDGDGQKSDSGSAADLRPASGEESSSEDETAGERRLRLAEQYLENIKGDTEDAIGFDAEEIDRDLIAERLKDDVAETKGRLHHFLAGSLDFKTAVTTRFRVKSQAMTGVAICAPYAYTVSKDIILTKWKLPEPIPESKKTVKSSKNKQKPFRRRPERLCSKQGSRGKQSDSDYQLHTGHILCVAASSDGQFVVTGGADKKVIVYKAEDLTPLRVFPQHRDAITSLSFRKGTNQLFSSSKDRTIKVWSLDELAYVETLFGHQDEVIDVAAYPNIERCVSVGARDRTARVWKVVEETQLVFRGGGGENKRPRQDLSDIKNGKIAPKPFAEHSIDRVAITDTETFVTGSSNGTLSVWSLNKKKAVFTHSLAHGLDVSINAEEASAETYIGPDFKPPERQPRGITALASLPLSDIIISGSWDGSVRAWRVGENKRSLEALGVLGNVEDSVADDIPRKDNDDDDGSGDGPVKGFINDLAIHERGAKGKETLCVVAAIGTEPRLGRWKKARGRSGAVVWEIPRKNLLTLQREQTEVAAKRTETEKSETALLLHGRG